MKRLRQVALRCFFGGRQDDFAWPISLAKSPLEYVIGDLKSERIGAVNNS